MLKMHKMLQMVMPPSLPSSNYKKPKLFEWKCNRIMVLSTSRDLGNWTRVPEIHNNDIDRVITIINNNFNNNYDNNWLSKRTRVPQQFFFSGEVRETLFLFQRLFLNCAILLLIFFFTMFRTTSIQLFVVWRLFLGIYTYLCCRGHYKKVWNNKYIAMIIIIIIII